jgi:UDP-N-acetylmuramoyl-tripeptide--D-alanyl-D-alanine ligase
MIPLRLAEVADVVGGDLADEEDADLLVDKVTIDSRQATDGTLFVPLPGEHADGHDFVADACARGANGYLLEAGRPVPAERGAVVVDTPADALLGLGAWMRETVDPTVVAVTGSTGKTTTKDLIAAAVGADRRVVANTGSFNNDLGVPLTCCRLDRDTEVLVSEIGARGFGHIAKLAAVIRPDVAVLTTIGPSHLELFGSVDAVARAKGELVEALEGPGSTAVLNADDPRVAALAGRAPGHVVTYGYRGDADWRAEDVRLDEHARASFDVVGPGVRLQVRLAVPGVHNVSNALAAVAVAAVCGVPPHLAVASLATAGVSRWRMELATSPGGYQVLNDAYNANPDSMAAALDTLAAMPARRRVAVLGLMGELGPVSEESHHATGRRCAELGLDTLVVVGEDHGLAAGAREAGFGGTLRSVDDAEAAYALLAGELGVGDTVLVKASRSVGLERLADALLRQDASRLREPRR